MRNGIARTTAFIGIGVCAGLTNGDGGERARETPTNPADGQLCYANCDGSSTAPVLTPNDFLCFLNKFAAGNPYANCDGSTTVPVLTPNDFQCFLNSYAAGCP